MNRYRGCLPEAARAEAAWAEAAWAEAAWAEAAWAEAAWAEAARLRATIVSGQRALILQRDNNLWKGEAG